MFLSPNLDHMLLEHIEGGKLHHFKAELDGRCPGVPTEGFRGCYYQLFLIVAIAPIALLIIGP